MSPVSDTGGRQLADPTSGAAREFWRLPEDELPDLLALIRQIGRVELKHLVPASAHERLFALLDADLDGAQHRRVSFLDTPDLALERRGVVARVRSIGGSWDDSVIKLRPVPPGGLRGLRRGSRELAVEVDGMPGSYVCSAALKARLGAHRVERVMTRGRPLRTLFTPPQLALFAAYGPAHVALDDLVVFGPIEVRRRRVHPVGLSRAVVLEQWTYPDGSRLLECSVRCSGGQAFPMAAQLAALLTDGGISLAGPQQTKTRATLDFFHRRWHGTPAAPAR
jgi:hypothetical protein